VTAFPAAAAKHDGYTSSQAWPQIQNPTNGLMGLKKSECLSILVLGLAPVGMDPRTVSSHAGSMIACTGSALLCELITHIDSIPTAAMNHSELHRALQGPEYTSVSLGIADLQGNAQTISILMSLPKTSQISWARAVKPLRDRRRELEKTVRGLTKDEEIECASLSVGEAAFVRLWPKLRAHGFHTFDTIPRLNPTVARTKFSCPILVNRTRFTPCCLPNGWTNCGRRRATSPA